MPFFVFRQDHLRFRVNLRRCTVPIIHELYEKVVCFFIYSTFKKIKSFPWKLNRYSYGVQFGINCAALNQSKLGNFVGCTIIMIIIIVIKFNNNNNNNSNNNNTTLFYYASHTQHSVKEPLVSSCRKRQED